MLTQSSIYKEYLDLMDTEAWKQDIELKIYKLQQIFRPRIISDASTSEKLYNGEIKMYFYLWRNKDVLLLCDGGVRTHADFDCCA